MSAAALDLYLRRVFQGPFRLERHVSTPALRVEGKALFTPAEDNCHLFQEKGTYLLNGEEQPFYQERYFVFEPSGFLIQKQDRSPLHSFTYGEIKPGDPIILTHTHLCDQDTYHLTLKVLSEETFHMDYDVASPTDPYTVTSLYTLD